MSASTTSLAVVIASYHRLERIPRLVDEYCRQGADQIVVVLDGPHPGWQQVLMARRGMRVLELAENKGLALARIAGLRAATADVILAVDDDVEPAPGLVERHRSFHASEPGDHVLQGYMPVALPERRGRDDAPTYLYASDYETQVNGWRTGDSTLILTSLWGGNLSLRRSLYERAEDSKPSERLEYNEDLDLGLRLLELGATATFDEDAYAAHHHARDLQGFLRECVVRGEAITVLETRWGHRPAQLNPLVTIPPGYNRVAGVIQQWICRRDRGGALQRTLVIAYRVAGCARAWPIQDAVTRLLRRAIIMRGYRLSDKRRNTQSTDDS